MPNKWCPAGKIECELFYEINGEFPSCNTHDHFTSFPLRTFTYICEQCPWPSRQRPIAPEPQPPQKTPLLMMREGFNGSDFPAKKQPQSETDVHNAAVDECVEAVDKILQKTLHAVACSALAEAIAALEAVKK